MSTLSLILIYLGIALLISIVMHFIDNLCLMNWKEEDYWLISVLWLPLVPFITISIIILYSYNMAGRLGKYLRND